MDKNRYRTQLYLDETQYRFLRETAARYETSIAAVVRDLIDKEMGSMESVDEDDPLFRISQSAVRTGRTDGSVAHDRYIYRQQPQQSGDQQVPGEGGDRSS
ncbi:MAG: hypothetical protein HPY55_08515 [Firmicutes bacterium]|nr:hypothetical protein [Bacillota bacterium]